MKRDLLNFFPFNHSHSYTVSTTLGTFHFSVIIEKDREYKLVMCNVNLACLLMKECLCMPGNSYLSFV